MRPQAPTILDPVTCDTILSATGDGVEAPPTVRMGPEQLRYLQAICRYAEEDDIIEITDDDIIVITRYIGGLDG